MIILDEHATITITRAGHRAGAHPVPSVAPHDAYVDAFWIPAIGPVPVATYRLLVTLSACPEPVWVSAAELTARLGLGPAPASWDALRSAIGALDHHGLATCHEDGNHAVALQVLDRVPQVPPRVLTDLPGCVASTHATWLRGRPTATSPAVPASWMPAVERLLQVEDEVYARVTDAVSSLMHDRDVPATERAALAAAAAGLVDWLVEQSTHTIDLP